MYTIVQVYVVNFEDPRRVIVVGIPFRPVCHNVKRFRVSGVKVYGTLTLRRFSMSAT